MPLCSFSSPSLFSTFFKMISSSPCLSTSTIQAQNSSKSCLHSPSLSVSSGLTHSSKSHLLGCPIAIPCRSKLQIVTISPCFVPGAPIIANSLRKSHTSSKVFIEEVYTRLPNHKFSDDQVASNNPLELPVICCPSK